MADEITPTRVIPAGEPLPVLPDRPPGPGEVPPWLKPAPVPAPEPAEEPPADAPGDDPDTESEPVIHVHVTLATPEQDTAQDEPGRWERLTAGVRTRIRPWQALLALTAAVLPIPRVGDSTATIWAYCVAQTRADHGIGWGYALGFLPLTLAATVIVRRGGTVLRLWLLAVTAIGATGAISLFDPITALTGVRP